MEIRNQAVNHLEFISRIDKDIRPSTAGTHMSVLICNRLERTRARGTNRYDLATICLRLIDRIGSLLINHIELTMHMMF